MSEKDEAMTDGEGEVPGGATESVDAPSDPWNEFVEVDDDEAEEFSLASEESLDDSQTPVPATPVAAEAPPAPESPAPAPVEQAPAPTPVEEPPALQAPQPPAQDLGALRSQWESQLASEYAMTEDEAMKFVTETGTMLPTLAAKLHVRIFDQVMQTVVGMMQQQVPQIVESVQTSKKVANDAEEAFFSEWEELRQHRDKVMEVARTYRQLNPKASPEEFRKTVGMQAWMVLGKSPAELVVKLNGGQVPGAAAAAPGGKVTQLPPMRPPTSGIPSAVARPQAGNGNVFSEMAETWYEELD